MVYCRHRGMPLRGGVSETILATCTYMASLDGAVADSGLLNAGAALTFDPRELPSRIITFADVQNHWQGIIFSETVRMGLFTGTGDGYFVPDSVMTRAMLVTTLYRMAGSPDTERRAGVFRVDPGAYYGPAASWACAVKITDGTGDGIFSPDAPVTREQTAAHAVPLRGLGGDDVSARGVLGVYTDYRSISSYAAEPLSWANGAGIIQRTYG
jgi:hypothetical protein